MALAAQLYRFWVFDTRSVWPGTKIADAASEAWPLLSNDEQTKASKYHFFKDAKLSIASSLLKRHFVSTMAKVPWADVTFSRLGDAVHGKPVYRSSEGAEPMLDFNVSHQAGLVTLVGCASPGVLLGTDVVCVNERNVDKMIEQEGFDAWVNMHAEVFSDTDVAQMKQPLTGADHETSEAKLRRFYAFWALKEAYVKLEGEALLASWLKDVEFRNVRCPEPANTAKQQTLGDTATDIEVWLRGEKVEDVKMSLQAFEEHFMIATAIKGPSEALIHKPNYALLHVGGVVGSNAEVKP